MIFQKGPLSNYLYKKSVSLRGSYWDAAFETGKDHLLFGVGFDSFGDWYRRARSLKAATWMPGPETITNVAHNYYLDIFAYGGLLLLVSYLFFTLLGVVLSIRILKIQKNYDYLSAALIAIFIGFQAQAIISIPQIGLAIWGWVIIGMLYSYERFLVDIKNDKVDRKPKNKAFETPIGILIFIGASIGILLGVPPYSSDAKFTKALNSRDLKQFELALDENYFNPANSEKYLRAISLLEQSKLYDQAHNYALRAVRFNSDSFNSWKMLYFLSASTPEERGLALVNMKRLDPLNRNLDKLK